MVSQFVTLLVAKGLIFALLFKIVILTEDCGACQSAKGWYSYLGKRICMSKFIKGKY